MKLSQIKKLNDVMSMQSENFEFFKSLFKHCESVVQMVPDDFVNELFKEIYLVEDNFVDSIIFGKDRKSGNTFVAFEIYDKADEDFRWEKYVVEKTKFEFRDVSMKIYFDKEDEVAFYISDSDFTPRDVKRIFGKFIVDFTGDYDYVQVLTKCFD